MKSEKKLLFVLTYYAPHWTGLTRYAINLAEGLAPEYEIQVSTTKHDSSLSSEEVINGVLVFRSDVIGRISRTLVSPGLLVKTVSLLRDSNAVVMFLPFAEAIVITVLAKLLNKKIILVHNGDLILPKGVLNRCIERIFYFTTRISIALSDTVVAYSHDYAQHSRLLKDFSRKTTVMFPPFTKPEQPSLEQCRKLNKIIRQGAGTVVGFAGRFVEEKGIDILFDAMPKVIQTIPDARFVLAGDTHVAYESFLENNMYKIERISDHVLFTGLLSRDSMSCFYRAIDLLVLPSRSECLGAVQIESMLCGTPVVATDIPGGRTAVLETGFGVISKANDSDALASAICTLSAKRSQIVNRFRDKPREIFDITRSMKEWRYTLRKYIG